MPVSDDSCAAVFAVPSWLEPAGEAQHHSKAHLIFEVATGAARANLRIRVGPCGRLGAGNRALVRTRGVSTCHDDPGQLALRRDAGPVAHPRSPHSATRSVSEDAPGRISTPKGRPARPARDATSMTAKHGRWARARKMSVCLGVFIGGKSSLNPFPSVVVYRIQS